MFSDLYLDYQHRHFGHALLWPVWVWTVHVPTRRSERLNTIARAVLGLYATGSDDAEWIASWLGIDAELVRYIVAAQLVPNGWLDRRKRITDAGRKQLEGDAVGAVEQRAGLLFQSAESSTLWPRFRGSLREIEPISRNERYPKFFVDRDSGRSLSPFLVRPETVTPPAQPTIAQIQAALYHDRIARHEHRLRDQDAPDLDDMPAGAIEFVDNAPYPAWLLCRVYRKQGSEQPWLVSDPLGQTRAADWMRKEVYDASLRARPLAGALTGLLGEADEPLDWEAYRRQKDETVRFEVLIEYPGAGQVPGLEDALIALLRFRSTVESAGTRARLEEISGLLIHAQKVLECCCIWCLEEWPLNSLDTRLPRKMKNTDLQQALRYAAPDLSSQFIEGLRVQPGKVFSALKFGTGSLRQYLAGLLLSLADHPNHPFHPLAVDETLMLRVLELSHDRDAAGHGGGAKAGRADSTKAILHAQTTLNIVHSLIEGL